jgi:predicted membrane metal-binding protein
LCVSFFTSCIAIDLSLAAIPLKLPLVTFVVVPIVLERFYLRLVSVFAGTSVPTGSDQVVEENTLPIRGKQEALKE